MVRYVVSRDKCARYQRCETGTSNILSGECVISSVLSHHNKNLKRWTGLTALRWTSECYSSMLQLSFIQKIKENTSSRHDSMPTQKTRREEGETTALWLLFLYVFSPPPGFALCTLGQPEGLFGLLEVLNFGPQTFLCSIFRGFSLSYLLTTAILDSFFLF